LIPDFRRAFAVLLLAVVSFPLISPLLSAPRPEAKLPPCCRKDGKHACGMMLAADADHMPGDSAWKSRRTACPLFPTGRATPAVAKASALGGGYTFAVPVPQLAAFAVQPEAQYRASFSRSCQKRGPPSFFA